MKILILAETDEMGHGSVAGTTQDVVALWRAWGHEVTVTAPRAGFAIVRHDVVLVATRSVWAALWGRLSLRPLVLSFDAATPLSGRLLRLCRRVEVVLAATPVLRDGLAAAGVFPGKIAVLPGIDAGGRVRAEAVLQVLEIAVLGKGDRAGVTLERA